MLDQCISIVNLARFLRSVGHLELGCKVDLAYRLPAYVLDDQHFLLISVSYLSIPVIGTTVMDQME